MNWLARKFQNSPLPIAIKWALLIGMLITVVMVSLGWLLISQQQNVHHRQVEEFGKVLVEQLAYSASEPLLANDQFILQGLISRQTKNQDVVGAAIINTHGVREESGIIPKNLPQQDQSDSVDWSMRGQDYQTKSLTTFYSPIVFQDLVAGQAVLTIDRGFLDRQLARTIRLIGIATLGLILIAGGLSYVLSRKLSQPISALAKAADGKETSYLTMFKEGERQDEIGQMVSYFNRLSAGLLEKRQVEEALSRYVSPVVAEKILSNLSQPRLANQEVNGTILFCDIVGFTELSEDLPPDEVASLLNLYLGMITEAAHYAGGSIDKFIGDSAMILFGVPVEDIFHARQSILCAWLIQTLVRHINRERRHKGKNPIQLRIGINSGPMLAGNIGTPDRMEYTVVGDTVNLASRLCSLAPVDGIMIGETTVDQPGVSDMVELYSQHPIKVRGRKTLVTPSIVGNPTPQFAQWLMKSVDYILEKPTG